MLGIVARKGKLQRAESGRQRAGEEDGPSSLALRTQGPESLWRRRKPVWEFLQPLEGRGQELSSSNFVTCFLLTFPSLNIPVNHFRCYWSTCVEFLCPQWWETFRDPLNYKNCILVFWESLCFVCLFGITGPGFGVSTGSVFLSCDLVQSSGEASLHDSLAAAWTSLMAFVQVCWKTIYFVIICLMPPSLAELNAPWGQVASSASLICTEWGN